MLRPWGPFGDHTPCATPNSPTFGLAGERRIPCLTCRDVESSVLGVKGSQVQILSSRQAGEGPWTAEDAGQRALSLLRHDRARGYELRRRQDPSRDSDEAGHR